MFVPCSSVCPAGVSSVEIPRFVQRIDSQDIYLTYDDGPNPGVTDALLDLLRDRGARATFFVHGMSVDADGAAEIVRRAAAEGHTIGNHGYQHDGQCPQFCRMDDWLVREIGVRSRFIRPPFGHAQAAVSRLRLRGDRLAVLWSLCLEDWLPVDLGVAARSVADGLWPGTIVLLHDGAPPNEAYRDRTQVMKLTDIILDECAARGMTAKNLDSAFS